MAISVVMPALEMAQENGKLLAWRKTEGDHVTKGEPLLEVETDKAVVEIEAPGDGILAGITAQVGAVIPVGETIAWLVAPGEKPPLASATAAPAARAASASHATGAVSAPEKSAAPVAASATQITPKARRLAKELGVDIGQIRGTGPDGTITSEDVQEAAHKAAPAVAGTAANPSPESLSQVARLMAERTTQSWTSVPHFFLVKSVDAGKLLDAGKKFGESVSITDVLIAVLGRVLARYPRMNSSWTGTEIRHNSNINVSVAMAVKDGVVGAVIPQAGSKTVSEISSLRRELTDRARGGKLRPADITGGTFTLSNLGMYKVDAFSAIITPPQAAVLAVGAIVDTVVALNGKPAVRPMMTMTLSSDHRVADGARAAEFLGALAGAILEPEKWIE